MTPLYLSNARGILNAPFHPLAQGIYASDEIISGTASSAGMKRMSSDRLRDL